jgi:ketosteroid isomerase-like protein
MPDGAEIRIHGAKIPCNRRLNHVWIRVCWTWACAGMEKKNFSGITKRIRAAADRRGSAQDDTDPERRHLQSIQEQIDAIARGDMDSALANASPDVQLDIFAPPEFKWISHAQGIPEFRRALAENFGSVEEQRPEVANVIAQGDTVVLVGRETGRIRATGEAYDVEFVHRFTFRDGKLISVRIIAAKHTEKNPR